MPHGGGRDKLGTTVLYSMYKRILSMDKTLQCKIRDMKKIKISDKKFQRKFSTNNDATCKKIELD